jgi:hydrogenase-4 component B
MPAAPAFVLALTALFGLGFLVPILFPARRATLAVALSFGLAGSLLAAAVTAAVAFGLRPELPAAALTGSNWLEFGPIRELSWLVQVDRLAAFFGLLVSGFAALVAVYSFPALRAPQYHGQRERIAAAFNLFVWSTLVVVFVADGFSLLISLEVMTLAFGYLALYKHTYTEIEGHSDSVSEEARKSARLAPQVYLIVSHTSTVFLLVAISLLALSSRSLSYAAWMNGARDLVGWVPHAVFLLAFAGLAIRAGLTPAHFWVSLVHPASPTPTHAFSLGIAIKVAVYLMIRFFFQFLEPQLSWGFVLLLAGGITAVVNVWYAISSHDLKTALAYHSIENIGIIVAPLGAAIILGGQAGEAARGFAGLALTASLYHTLNHAVFKGLLYMATGAIDNATGGVVEIDRLGGLIKLYPWTSAAFLVGAVAISGLPPLNGFVSEWLALQSLLRGMAAARSAHPAASLALLAGMLLLVAAFALTVFCFYKLAGLALLGQPRLPETERRVWQGRDAAAPMLAVMGVLALLCLGLGLLPGVVTPWLAGLTAPLAHGWPIAAPGWSELTLSPLGLRDTPQLPVLAAFGIASLLVAASVLLRPGKDARRPALPWNYATPFDPATMQPTSASLSDLVRRLPARPAAAEPPGREVLPATFVLSESDVYPQSGREVFRVALNAAIGRLLAASEWTGRRAQGGDIRQYLGYIFAANLLTLLLFLIVEALAK